MRKKRNVFLAVSLAAMLAVNSFSGVEFTQLKCYATAKQQSAETNTNGFVIKNGVLTGYTGTATEITMPDTVTEIASTALKGNTTITKVTVPGTVEEIPSYCFYGCKKLQSVVLLDGVKTIGTSVFMECDKTTSVTIPASVTSINDYAFDLDKKDNYTILGDTGSVAETYAKEKNIEFKDVKNMTNETTATESETVPKRCVGITNVIVAEGSEDGKGDATLIDFGNREYGLIDTGKAETIDELKKAIVANCKVNEKDGKYHFKAIVISHFHNDHCGAFQRLIKWQDGDTDAEVEDEDTIDEVKAGEATTTEDSIAEDTTNIDKNKDDKHKLVVENVYIKDFSDFVVRSGNHITGINGAKDIKKNGKVATKKAVIAASMAKDFNWYQRVTGRNTICLNSNKTIETEKVGKKIVFKLQSAAYHETENGIENSYHLEHYVKSVVRIPTGGIETLKVGDTTMTIYGAPKQIAHSKWGDVNAENNSSMVVRIVGKNKVVDENNNVSYKDYKAIFMGDMGDKGCKNVKDVYKTELGDPKNSSALFTRHIVNDKYVVTGYGELLTGNYDYCKVGHHAARSWKEEDLYNIVKEGQWYKKYINAKFYVFNVDTNRYDKKITIDRDERETWCDRAITSGMYSDEEDMTNKNLKAKKEALVEARKKAKKNKNENKVNLINGKIRIIDKIVDLNADITDLKKDKETGERNYKLLKYCYSHKIYNAETGTKLFDFIKNKLNVDATKQTKIFSKNTDSETKKQYPYNCKFKDMEKDANNKEFIVNFKAYGVTEVASEIKYNNGLNVKNDNTTFQKHDDITETDYYMGIGELKIKSVKTNELIAITEKVNGKEKIVKKEVIKTGYKLSVSQRIVCGTWEETVEGKEVKGKTGY